MKTETIIFVAIVLVNGAIAIWKKRKERAAAAAAARRTGPAAKPVAAIVARPATTRLPSSRASKVVVPVRTPPMPAAERTPAARPAERTVPAPPVPGRAPAALRRPVPSPSVSLAARLRTGFLFAEIYGKPRWQAPLH